MIRTKETARKSTGILQVGRKQVTAVAAKKTAPAPPRTSTLAQFHPASLPTAIRKTTPKAGKKKGPRQTKRRAKRKSDIHVFHLISSQS